MIGTLPVELYGLKKRQSPEGDLSRFFSPEELVCDHSIATRWAPSQSAGLVAKKSKNKCIFIHFGFLYCVHLVKPVQTGGKTWSFLGGQHCFPLKTFSFEKKWLLYKKPSSSARSRLIALASAAPYKSFLPLLSPVIRQSSSEYIPSSLRKEPDCFLKQ